MRVHAFTVSYKPKEVENPESMKGFLSLYFPLDHMRSMQRCDSDVIWSHIFPRKAQSNRHFSGRSTVLPKTTVRVLPVIRVR